MCRHLLILWIATVNNVIDYSLHIPSFLGANAHDLTLGEERPLRGR